MQCIMFKSMTVVSPSQFDSVNLLSFRTSRFRRVTFLFFLKYETTNAKFKKKSCHLSKYLSSFTLDLKWRWMRHNFFSKYRINSFMKTSNNFTLSVFILIYLLKQTHFIYTKTFSLKRNIGMYIYIIELKLFV